MEVHTLVHMEDLDKLWFLFLKFERVFLWVPGNAVVVSVHANMQ